MRAFVNWSGVHRATPARWVAPRSDAEVADALREAARRRDVVTAVGSGHSWSDAAVPRTVALELSALRGVVAIDEATPSITVLGGTRLEEITAALDARGLAMPILGSIAKQTIAGAIATGTHGSSLRHGNLASLVTQLRLVTPRGDVLDLDASDPRFAAARVHLGALGVVTRVTLAVTRAFRLVERRESVPVGDVVRDLDAFAASAEFVKLWWLPSTGKMVVFRYDRTDEPARATPVLDLLDEVVLNRLVFEGALRVVGRFPRATWILNGAVASTYLGPGRRVARSDKAFHLAMPPKHREAEWAFPMARAKEALAELVAFVARSRVRVNFPCEVRFVKGDDAWMSPAHGADTCQIGVYQAQSPDLAAYFDGAQGIAARLGGRPHWGKEHAWSTDAIARAFPRHADFVALARELDPEATMENAFVARALGERR